jgi:hypothetical protein
VVLRAGSQQATRGYRGEQQGDEGDDPRVASRQGGKHLRQELKEEVRGGQSDGRPDHGELDPVLEEQPKEVRRSRPEREADG